MLICPEHKFLYIHIHKNAGKAVKHCLVNVLKKEKKANFFVREWQGDKIHNHISLPVLLKTYPDLKSFFSFATVRNPWDKLASAYFWIKSKPENAPDINRSHLDWAADFPSFVYALYESFKLNEQRNDEDNIFKRPSVSLNPKRLAYPPQSVYLYKPEDNIAPSAICKQENLEQDLKKIVHQLLGPSATKRVKLKVVGPSAKPSYQKLYSQKIRDMVGEIYAEDIERFGYDF